MRMDKEEKSSNYIDEVIEFAKNLLNSRKYRSIKDSLSIYKDSLADDCGRCHQVDIRAYYVSWD